MAGFYVIPPLIIALFITFTVHYIFLGDFNLDQMREPYVEFFMVSVWNFH